MISIKIKNFGPIGKNNKSKDGLFTIDFSPVTVFIGHQASGKSTLAKLFSTFMWFEKNINRSNIIPNGRRYVSSDIINKLFKNQEIDEYFTDDTEIIYFGNRINFYYKEHKLTINQEIASQIYSLPKIQYISSARNILSILYKISNKSIVDKDGNFITLSDNIPFMVRNLYNEYINALKKIESDNKDFNLHINDITVSYKNGMTFINTKGKKISMSASSSGIQSLAPLLIVSNFLTEQLQQNLVDRLSTISQYLKTQIEKELIKINNGELIEEFHLYTNNIIDIKESVDKNNTNISPQLLNVIKRFLPSYFVNIVEEPEQNLFPKTQADILYELLKYKNTNKSNMLIISTHSPYILTALNNAIFAKDVFDKTKKSIKELPENKTIAFKNISAYKLENRNIISIKNEDNRLIDAEQIDECSIKIDTIFNKLLDLNNE